ncbi:hypothetical protein [Enterovibrio norvegicus]|uniref:RipA family octameric membrane protein n=1 Tax=Enterovibrio norvegicus TaxID=188144 RepID=UPI0003775E58|nr:hypothetical protein [Enterovibrio norvegicus]OEF57943.1 hypothetical protein A1OU_06980 [Enterovibrio norvegicus]
MQPEAKNIHTLKSLYEISIETRNFEINQLIQRNNFFMLFQGVLLAAVMQTEASKPFVEIIICLVGIMISIYQLQMSSGAKYWQEWWESRVNHFEQQLCDNLQKIEGIDTHLLFTVNSQDVNRTVRERLLGSKNRSITNACILGGFSVGRAPIKVSIFLLCAWVVLFLSSINYNALPEFQFSEIFKGFHFN